VTGVIQAHESRSEKGIVSVDLGKLEAMLPATEQVPGEAYEHGHRIKCVVVHVAKGFRGPQVTLSRSHPSLVKKLFALEVPGDRRRHRGDRRDRPRGLAIVRRSRCGPPSPGVNAKGAVHRAHGLSGRGRDERAARREDRHHRLVGRPGRLRGQRLSPAKALRVQVIDAANRTAGSPFPDFQLSLAIGREGQNARLRAVSRVGRSTSGRTTSRPGETEVAVGG
jgi:N utilization substance protein A